MIAPATALGDLGAIVELQILGETEPDFGQPGLVAADRDSGRSEPGIGFDESILNRARRDGQRRFEVDIIRRDFYRRARRS